MPDLDFRPRILCLHGGGVTAEIFSLQSRSLIKSLPQFRLVFADGPFFCAAGPGIVPVYESYGPFRRWLRWLPIHAEIDDEAAVEEVMYAIHTTKLDDDAAGGRGEWVGVLGFSQGAKLAASLLYEQQVQIEKTGRADTDYKFGVLLAGRHPLVSLSELSRSEALVNAGDISEGFEHEGVSEHVLSVPTIHVHGVKDGGLHLHRKLRDKYCEPDSVKTIEWEGDHRVPLKKVDVEPIMAEILKVARDQGVNC